MGVEKSGDNGVPVLNHPEERCIMEAGNGGEWNDCGTLCVVGWIFN